MSGDGSYTYVVFIVLRLFKTIERDLCTASTTARFTKHRLAKTKSFPNPEAVYMLHHPHQNPVTSLQVLETKKRGVKDLL